MNTTKISPAKGQKNTNTALAKNQPIESMSFDDIMNLDEKELNKQMSLDQKKLAKKSQLQAKIIDINAKKSKAQHRFNLSLIDPTIDSVEMKIEIDCLNDEAKIAYQILVQLFPNEYTSPLD
jgi:hypothetical protein